MANKTTLGTGIALAAAVAAQSVAAQNGPTCPDIIQFQAEFCADECVLDQDEFNAIFSRALAKVDVDGNARTNAWIVSRAGAEEARPNAYVDGRNQNISRYVRSLGSSVEGSINVITSGDAFRTATIYLSDNPNAMERTESGFTPAYGQTTALNLRACTRN